MTANYEVLQANYVHDSIMAGQMAYFARLCRMCAVHIQDPSCREEFLGQVQIAFNRDGCSFAALHRPPSLGSLWCFV